MMLFFGLTKYKLQHYNLPMLDSRTTKQPQQYSTHQNTNTSHKDRLFLFKYNDKDRPFSPKYQQTEHKYQKSANYLLKKEELRQKRDQNMRRSTQAEHRNNLDRLYQLISKSRTFTSREGDSGIQKLVKIVSKILNGHDMRKVVFDILKKYTMTCSSTYQLCLQSKHNLKDLKDTIKYKPSQKVQLDNISENPNENTINIDQTQRMNNMKKYKGMDYSRQWRKMDSPIKNNDWNSGQQLTTQQDLSLQLQQFNNIRQHHFEDVVINSIAPNNFVVGKANRPTLQRQIPLYTNIEQQKQQQQEMASMALNSNKVDMIFQVFQEAPCSSQSDEIGLMFSQVAFLFKNNNNNNKNGKNSVVNKSSGGGRRGEEILQMQQYAIPRGITQVQQRQKQKTKVEYGGRNKGSQEKEGRVNSSTKPQSILKKSRYNRQMGHSRNRQSSGVITASDYAAKMLYGPPQQIYRQPQVQPKQQPRLSMMQQDKTRKRVTSLPRITFTYSSRDKYEVSPQMRYAATPSFTKLNSINSSKNNSNGSSNNINNGSNSNTRMKIRPTTSTQHLVSPPKSPSHYTMRQTAINPIISSPSNPFFNTLNHPNPSSHSHGIALINPYTNTYLPQNQYYNITGKQSATTATRYNTLNMQPKWNGSKNGTKIGKEEEGEVEYGRESRVPACCWNGEEEGRKGYRARSLQLRPMRTYTVW